MDIKDLKAHAYDCMYKIEALQRELQATNQEIARKQSEQKNELNKQPLKAEVVEDAKEKTE